jgi:sulfite exporter TauE/SafE
MEKTVHACCLPNTTPLKTRLWHACLAILALAFLGAYVLPVFAYLLPGGITGTSMFALLLLGVVASVSTCLASTGAFLLVNATKFTSRREIFALHAGRFGAFVFGGALLGGIGGALGSSPLFYGALGLLLGAGFLIIGLQLLDIAPKWMRRLSLLPEALHASRYTLHASWLIGASTFFLPCGFTQTAQGLALASGSPAQGALLLGAFAIGTAPVLVGISLFGSGVSVKTPWLRLATGAMLFLFAFGQIDGGLTVLGSPFTFAGTGQQILSMVMPTALPAQAQEQVVQMTVAGGAFSPNRFTVRRGVPVLWAVEGEDISGCASTLISPRLGITRALSHGTNVIRFTPNESGTIPFSCSMGMIRGSFNVIP